MAQCMPRPRAHIVVLDKPEHSVFDPSCVVREILSDLYWTSARGKRRPERSLAWMADALDRFFIFPSRNATGIINLDNQALMAQEARDAHQLCRWASDTIRRALRAGADNPHIFEETALPLLCATSFRGSVDDLVAFLTTLEREANFIYVAGTDACAKGALREANLFLDAYETTRLPRHARSAVTRTMMRHRHNWGGSVILAACGLAMLWHTWNEMRDESHVRLGIMEAETSTPCPPPP